MCVKSFNVIACMQMRVILLIHVLAYLSFIQHLWVSGFGLALKIGARHCVPAYNPSARWAEAEGL